MVRPIDRFIAAIHRGAGEELIFSSGQPVRTRAGQQWTVLLAQPVRADQIQTILADIVPAELEQGFASDGETSFSFETATGPFQAHLRRKQGQLDAIIQPLRDSAPPGAPPSPFAASGASAAPTPPPPPSPRVTGRFSKDALLAGDTPRKQIDPLLVTLVQHKASDLHITAGMHPRMRKDGDIMLLPGYDGAVLLSDTIRTMLMEVAPSVAREKFEKTNDADYSYEIPGVARFRVNAFKDRRGTSGVLRVIPSKILTAEDLNLPKVTLDMCTMHKGLVLVTGPTGSGKSTTLAALIDHINKKRSDHIITIEDPIEFVHETKNCLVNQREIHVDTMGFKDALRAALREDPDILLVGEMRDLETVAIAIETAETGHLVFGTLHTNTAVGTIDRIVDQFPADRQEQIRLMLAESLKGVIAQTLCKKIGGGRVAALEILVVNTAVSNLIREAKTFQIPNLMQTQKSAGMQTLNDSLFQLVQNKIVAPEEAYAKSVDRAGFKMMLERAHIRLEPE